jgi:hypothetical protein
LAETTAERLRIIPEITFATTMSDLNKIDKQKLNNKSREHLKQHLLLLGKKIKRF